MLKRLNITSFAIRLPLILMNNYYHNKIAIDYIRRTINKKTGTTLATS